MSTSLLSAGTGAVVHPILAPIDTATFNSVGEPENDGSSDILSLSNDALLPSQVGASLQQDIDGMELEPALQPSIQAHVFVDPLSGRLQEQVGVSLFQNPTDVLKKVLPFYPFRSTVQDSNSQSAFLLNSGFILGAMRGDFADTSALQDKSWVSSEQALWGGLIALSLLTLVGWISIHNIKKDDSASTDARQNDIQE